MKSPQLAGSTLMSGGDELELEYRSQTTKNRHLRSVDFRLPEPLLKTIHESMVKSRCLEKYLIHLAKAEKHFWIGGPGEESFNIPLGMQVKCGQGPLFDILHLHYRSSGVLVAMGLDPVGPIRQIKNRVTDPFSGGRADVNFYSIPEWNVVPTPGPVATQFVRAIGSGISQKRHGGDGVTIVIGGDAGTSEGDFASCLVWASRPKFELPILMVVTNNGVGISTPTTSQHGEAQISDRGRAFGMKTMTINGMDPEESYLAIQECLLYVRRERKPALLEARVTRLYGHSSNSGANRDKKIDDSLENFEIKLVRSGVMTEAGIREIHERHLSHMRTLAHDVGLEPLPEPSSIEDFIYYSKKG